MEVVKSFDSDLGFLHNDKPSSLPEALVLASHRSLACLLTMVSFFDFFLSLWYNLLFYSSVSRNWDFLFEEKMKCFAYVFHSLCILCKEFAFVLLLLRVQVIIRILLYVDAYQVFDVLFFWSTKLGFACSHVKIPLILSWVRLTFSNRIWKLSF